MTGTLVHVVVPAGIDDVAMPSGGNTYDRRLCVGLKALGWIVCEHRVPGRWPAPTDADRRTLAEMVAAIPRAAVVVLDGLIASAAPDVLVPHAERLRLVVLVHMPLGNGSSSDANGTDAAAAAAGAESAVLAASVAVVTTSWWTRSWLLEHYDLSPLAVHVAEPGVDPADQAAGTCAGTDLLCIAAITPTKGHDVLVTALSMLADLTWRCTLVGSTDRAPAFVEQLRQQVRGYGLDERIRFTGPLVGPDLAAAYASADVTVLASRAETYGMVVTEALARGLPVVATSVGGLPEALGWDRRDGRPGLLVPPADPVSLAAAMRSWLEDGALRDRLRRSARDRRPTLARWTATAATVSDVLAGAAA